MIDLWAYPSDLMVHIKVNNMQWIHGSLARRQDTQRQVYIAMHCLLSFYFVYLILTRMVISFFEVTGLDLPCSTVRFWPEKFPPLMLESHFFIIRFFTCCHPRFKMPLSFQMVLLFEVMKLCASIERKCQAVDTFRFPKTSILLHTVDASRVPSRILPGELIAITLGRDTFHPCIREF